VSGDQTTLSGSSSGPVGPIWISVFISVEMERRRETRRESRLANNLHCPCSTVTMAE